MHHEHGPVRWEGGGAGSADRERERGGREQAATSIHISQTIKLELEFDTSLTNCLLNKRLELQHS